MVKMDLQLIIAEDGNYWPARLGETDGRPILVRAGGEILPHELVPFGVLGHFELVETRPATGDQITIRRLTEKNLFLRALEHATDYATSIGATHVLFYGRLVSMTIQPNDGDRDYSFFADVQPYVRNPLAPPRPTGLGGG